MRAHLIEKLRIKRGWSQAQLAAAAYVARATINRIERGKPATFDSAQRIAKALGVSLKEIAPEYVEEESCS
jgi:transcriptional regulator with XRE-family HTH domain